VCDTLAAVGSVTSTGATLFAKNSDRDHAEAQYLEWLPPARHNAGEKVKLTYQAIDQARVTHGVLLSKPHWIWGAEMGANAHGLVIGNEAIFAKLEASTRPGVIGMDYVRLALERAADVDEAIEVVTTVLRRYGQSGNCGFRRTLAYHNSFLLADRHSVKVLETVEREWTVMPVTDACAISNAMTIESFRSVFEDETRSVSGRYRRARATTLLQERPGSLQVRDLLRILRDHAEGPSIDGRPGARICAHRRENPIGQTTASWVSDLTPAKTIHWVTGTAAPCTGIFKPLLLDIGVPEHGPPPGALPESNSLWWRHEQLRRNLDESGPDVLASFDEERTALESGFLRAMAECPALVDPASRSQARATVENCWREAWDFESRWLNQTL